MRVSYFGYYVRSMAQDASCYQVDLTELFSKFATWNNAHFKGRFSLHGEFLYLLPLTAPVYLFVQTRDQELIKQIQRDTLTVADIATKLQANASIGFASYVLIEKNFIGFAARVLSPRVAAFGNFVNQLFDQLGFRYTFKLRTITYELPKDQINTLKSVGSFSVELLRNATTTQNVLNALGLTAVENIAELGEIEIKVKPASRKSNTKRAFQAVANSIPDGDIEGFEAKAKMETADRLSEYVIVGEGGVRDYIAQKNEIQIAENIVERSRNNTVLRRKIEEFSNDADFIADKTAADLGLDWKPPVDRTAPVRPE